ncbi:MAG: FAD-dependent oxidoreductase [Erysipelotrichaceae bacterium]|nr:FAD-dependent oxidoreductase [Erysipelotrichaceae bacterium]
MAKIIQIGANHAGTACANTILSYPNNELTIYDKNSNISFLGCGMALWIGKQINSGDGLFYQKPEDFEKKGAKVHLESEVIDVDYDNKKVKVRLKDGNIIEDSYDKLVLATGSIPNKPRIKGIDLENVQMVKLYQNAKEVIDKLKDNDYKRVVVLGGGYIGIELAEAFERLNKEVTLIDMEKHILNGYFDTEFSDEMLNVMKNHGIKFVLGEAVEEILGETKVTGVKTSNGVYEADMVICAIGFHPNSSLGKEHLEKYRNGAYLVNKKQQTSDKDVYAIGDCATIYDNARDRVNYIALATNAVRSGLIAGHNICGTEVETVGVQGSSALMIYDYKLVCTGMSVASALKEGVEVDYQDFEDTQKPAFMEVDNPKVKIRIVYRKSDKVIIGCQLASNYDMSSAIHLFSLAIQKKVTIGELALCDIFFMPHFNQPYNYITMAAYSALLKG